MTDTDNPLLTWDSLPPFAQIESAHIEPAVRSALNDCTVQLEALEADCQPDWSTVEIIERIGDRISRVYGPVRHLMGVKTSDELRAAHDAVQPEIVAFSTRLGQSQPIFAALTSLQDGDAWAGLDEAQQRIVDGLLKSARHAGVGLTGDKKERFNELRTRLAELGTTFGNHVLDATKAWHLDITDGDRLEGMPSTWRGMAAAAARADHPEADAEQGPWRLGLDFASLGPFLMHCRDRELREQVYRQSIVKASSGELDNQPLIAEILTLKREMAGLLGFASYADLSIDKKMAGSVAEVRAQLDELYAAAWPAAQREFGELTAYAVEHGAPKPLMNWDVGFWGERLREERLGLTDEQLRPYFSFERVLEALFALVRDLFDVTITPADGEAQVWNKDVRFFKLFNVDGAQIAACYLDPYSRPADKRGGAWMDDCVGRSVVLAPVGAAVRLPVAYLVCNQTPPVDDTPSLMTFREVETLFHEFGHALQHMLTSVDHGLASGIENVEWDAVELPSQFMENWCLHRPVLEGLAKHWQTGEAMPAEWIDRLQAQRTFQAGLATCRQLLFGITDLDLHEHWTADGDAGPRDLMMQVAERCAVVPPLPEDRFLCSFSHIFAGGYSAGYYSYKWAEILSADAFAAFEEAGLDDHAAIQGLGRRFRDTVLALGGGRHPMQVYQDFRGRAPSAAALLRHQGLAASA